MRRIVFALLSLAVVAYPPMLPAAEIAVLSPQTWDDYAPAGKEVDCIYGDYVLRNDQIVVVVAQPLATRNANMTVRNVGGAIIDLTRRDSPNDQLSAYYPGAGRYSFVSPAKVTVAGVERFDSKSRATTGKMVALVVAAEPIADRPALTVRYSLTDGQPYVLVETTYRNTTDKPVRDDLSDAIRADRTFTFGSDAASGLFWADDEWFRQSYGVLIDGYEIKGTGQRGTLLRLVTKDPSHDGKSEVQLEPGKSFTLARKIFPGDSLLQVRGTAEQLLGKATEPVTISVVDPAGPVAHAKLTLTSDGKPFGAARTDEKGKHSFPIAAGAYDVLVESVGRPSVTAKFDSAAVKVATVTLEAPGYVVASVTDGEGKATPCKVAFIGKDGTKDPDFGPDSGTNPVQNLHYSHTGKFRQEISPGKYDVIVSYGPEYDAVFTQIEVTRGEETQLSAKLVRSVDTKGWVSSDFHSHSSPSGDNTSSQRGRVLNLLCEHIEFAPCTEHNRIDTYVPHLKALGVESHVATCTGMELTGGLLPVNHQNAFPLVFKPRTQDGGGPVTDLDPVVQIERLAMWDNKSDKLVQMNHPNLPQILGDRDLDGKADAGFEKMFGFVDVIEIHPPEGIFTAPERGSDGKLGRNPIYHWMQMLNLGYRLAGVVNTDAHYNFHGSGWIRNYIYSSTDDPAKIDTMEMVHNSEKGHVTCTTGPYMEVSLTPGGSGSKRAIPGQDVRSESGECELQVRVQCPNWLDVNRVQVFLNGRAAKELNFTRRESPDRFGNGVVKFEAKLPLKLKTDTHVIVATIGEGLELGAVMGATFGKRPPCAVSNPIFVDVDGGGFKPNGDLLDVPLAMEGNRAR